MATDSVSTARLVIVEPADRAGLTFPLSEAQLVIGRSTSANFVIDDPFVSGRHALVMVDDSGQVAIRDLNSTSGTFVNGERVTGARVLEPSDMVRFADVVTRFEVGSPEPAATAIHPLPVARHPVVPAPPGMVSAPAPPDGGVPPAIASGDANAFVAGPERRRSHLGNGVGQGLIHLTLVIFLVLTLYPAVALIIFSFKTSLQWENSRWTLTLPLRWQNYQIAWDIIQHYLFNTILVASVSTIGATLLCSITAFAFARLRFPGREFFYWAIVFMLTVPTLLNLIPQFVLYHNLGLINTRWALIIQYIVQSGPFGVFLFRAFFRSIPEELFEAARIDGCNVLDLYWRITVPLSLPILGTYMIMSVQYIWNDYIWPTVAITDDSLQVMTVGLVKLAHNLTNTVGGDPNGAYGPQFAAYTIGALPLLVLFLFTSRYYIEGLTTSGLKL